MSESYSWAGPVTAPDTYRLVGLLGSGGEGAVWRAELPLSASGVTSVAVKIMRAIEDDEDEARRWAQFGHLLRSLSHPGLVRVIDVFIGPQSHRPNVADPATRTAYVVMDYIDGPTLREWSDENPDATAGQRLRMLRTVAAALDEMHSGAATRVPVAHGDVKPSNIVVRNNGGGTVLVDLGLTRLTDAVGALGRSAPYAAPELRAHGALVTPETDRFAFAATTAQVLTGQRPPTGEDGWIDIPALESLLSASPVTRRRPQLVREVLEALTSPPAGR
ncbi:MAG: serine/threonine protein kinase, partial [Actinomycetia bacterium]|nr:serine/threonine protein kinase [Actinomycetes bacterium]